ncbi:MAG: putative LPS assembly protein LptD [Candidatus Zixiibacteriota bacterium]
MPKSTGHIITLLAILALATTSYSQQKQKLVLHHADQFEVVLSSDNRYISYVTGHVAFKTETGFIYCDSARWLKGENVRLNGHVLIDERDYRLESDSVFYDLTTEEALALGKRVELWSYLDSLYAVGTHAFFSDKAKYFIMEQRPVVYIKYPDSVNMIEVIANTVEYDAATKTAEAYGDVKITSSEFSSASGCAVMKTETNTVDLFDQPSLIRGKSTVSGSLIAIYSENDVLSRIDVVDTARGEFKEPIDTVKGYYDESILSGNRIILDFDQGELSNITCWGQAYSWYFPSPRGGAETHQNSVSGDTIRFYIEQEGLERVDVVGGAVGRYITSKTRAADTALVMQVDTIDYNGKFIEYHIADSLIYLERASHVQSGTVALDAHKISFDTRQKIIEAYSAYLDQDTVGTKYSVAAQIQPNSIPVILRDKSQEIYGDYLLYSIDTEKGRIIQSKSDYQAGLYYGDKLYREQERIVYVDDGRYTTCDAEEPHFHFHSKHMKLIQDDKLIAKPVVFYVERIPVFALPYYVFPLKKGRHSGFLPFTFGQFQTGDRYIRDVGYYWAASEYWDLRASMDYHEIQQTLAFNTRMDFKKRYLLDGYLAGSYARETAYSTSVASESKSNRWTLRGVYNHTFSPSFSIRSSADFQSDKSYYTDYSQNLEERLNRNTKSQLSFSKRFANGISLSGTVTHNVDLDAESRTDNIPNLSMSFPRIWPFGSGSKDESGQLVKKWYNDIVLSYSPNLTNFSSRITRDSTYVLAIDTTIDSSLTPWDTTVVETVDTLSYRSRKKYAQINHNPSITLPGIKFGNYLNLTPRFSYSETWIRIYETDQSIDKAIDASTTYRTYAWNTGVSANTKLYGTVYPNIAGLTGLRHVITPTVSYTYYPDIDLHPEVRAFAGGGAGSKKSSVMGFRLENLFQAKYRKGENEVNKDLLSVSSNFSYDFEKEDKPLSNLSTSFSSSALPIIQSLSGSMTHTFYNPENDELDFWSPYLTYFNVDANFRIAGKNFLFDDPDEQVERGSLRDYESIADYAQPVAPTQTGGTRATGWSLTATYSYTESGRGEAWTKRSFIRMNLSFKLTPTTSITYSQQYDIERGLTVNNAVNIVRQLHCWSGSLYWVPIGSNRGFGFKLFVTEIPEIKIDSNHDTFLESLQ